MRSVEAYEVFNAHKARRFWAQTKTRWVDAAKVIQDAILGIEEEPLRVAVANMVDAIAKHEGAYVLESAPSGFNVKEIELDDEAIDRILDLLDGNEDVLDEAYDWIVGLMKGMSAPFIAWAFGPLSIPKEITNHQGQRLTEFASHRIVYSIRKQAISGVHTQPNYGHPKNRVIAVDL